MITVGFDGGHTVYDLGPVLDVTFFFSCVKAYVVDAYPDKDWEILTDRLYRRYLRKEELVSASVLMTEVREVLLSAPRDCVEWNSFMSSNGSQSWLDASSSTLGGLFYRYFELFDKAKESAISFMQEFGIYQPVRIVTSSLPDFIIEKNRSLVEYDALSGDDLPFWMSR